jgi:hypothetical protein
MSEVECSRPPQFPRHTPEAVANEELNVIVRRAIGEAVTAERESGDPGAEGFGAAVADRFYEILGTGAIASELEEEAEALPSRYLGETDVYETALQCVDRIDYQTYAHPAVLSPLMALRGDDGATYYVGTDKMSHFVQQSHDYLYIYRTVEQDHPGLGELYARAWGLWGEGIELTDEYVKDYLTSHDLPADDETAGRIKNEILSFMDDSDTVTRLNPTPGWAIDSSFLRWLGHDVVDLHRFGIYGDATTGIISYSDIAVNEAGLKFYFDLMRDPEGMAENFDIAHYVTPEWDEERLPSTFSPVIEERIRQAQTGDLKSPLVYGFDLQISGPDWTFAASMPLLYYSWRDIEWRLQLGASMPLTGDESRLASESMGFVSTDFDMRISGLNFAYLNFTAGFSKAIASGDPMEGFHPIFGAGYEVMFLGWLSLRLGFQFDINDYTPSFVIGLLRIWR